MAERYLNLGNTLRFERIMKEYEILFDTDRPGTLWQRSTVWQWMGWEAKSIGAIGAVVGIRGIYVLMEREKG